MGKLKVLFDAGTCWWFVPTRFRSLLEAEFDCVWLDCSGVNSGIRYRIGKWADVIFADWAMNWAKYYLETFPEKRIIVRTHRCDVWHEGSPFYQWENVDVVMFMDNFWRNIFVEECKKNFLDDLEERCVTVPRLVDEKHWRFLHDRTSVRKFGERLGMLGRFTPRKANLDIAKLMNEELNDFSLSLMGLTESDLKFYPEYVRDVKSQKGDIAIHKRTEGDQVVKFFAEVDFIISNSDPVEGGESWHASITEGMLCGCVPLVRHWPGADEMHPKESLFETTDEMVARLHELVALDEEDRKRFSETSRQWVLNRYKLEDVTDLYADIIRGEMDRVPLNLNPQEIIPFRKSQLCGGYFKRMAKKKSGNKPHGTIVPK